MKSRQLVLPILAVAGMVLSGCSQVPKDYSLDETPSFGDTVNFGGSATPDGWSSPSAGDTPLGISEIVDAQHPGAISKDKCTFQRSIEYIPSGYESRGDDYLTRDYIYKLSRTATEKNPVLKSVKVRTEDSPLEMLTASVTESLPEGASTESKVAVRALAGARSTGYNVESKMQGPYDADASRGLPVVFLKASCSGDNKIDDGEWNKLLDSTVVALNSPIKAPEEKVDVQPSPPAPPAPGMDPPATDPPATDPPAGE